MSYADAVLLMGGRDSRTVAALDRLAGGLLLAVSAAGTGFALSLFEAKGELARLSNELVRGLSERMRGLERFSRTERLAAAHSVIVLTAYFDTLSNVNLPFDIKNLELTKAEQAAIALGEAPSHDRLGILAASLLRTEVPVPAPQLPYEATIEAMRGFYIELSAAVARFVAGLAMWDRLDETRQHGFAEQLSDELPGLAVLRYQEMFRRLAVDFPEVAFWANLVDHQATREEVRRLSTGMAGLERVLAGIATGRVPDDRRMGLSRAYRVVLQRPVLSASDVPEGLRLPLLGDIYVNPDFRVAPAGQSARFAEESWWEGQPVRDDLEGFLLGHLTAPQAALAPLLVLGQPGSGKSVLTQVLAAQLPPSEFLVVRVVLREVAADADLQAQIEHAIRSATGETLGWPDLARSADGAFPVVLIDGFDELLQATGVSQTDYLRKIADFQAREADQGRPVAVLITSRTAVADRAQPTPGMVVARLEPFRETQIGQWLRVWNEANTATLAAQGLRPLPTQTVLDHTDLASQPLLLLMLALYDADGNRLQRANAALGEAELYERLLITFAEREIRKSGADLSGIQFQNAVEQELLRLSVVAFAMFSRGRQWVSDAELDADLPALLDSATRQSAPVGLRAPLSAAQVVVGRFFFVHEAQATRDNSRLSTYEFLHATFGEYLIARLVIRELNDLTDAAQLAASRTRRDSVDDAFLHALLSHMPMTMRGTIVSFLHELLRPISGSQRQHLSDLLLGLFRDALGPRHDTRYSDYAPLPLLPVPARHAAYSANLTVLVVLATGEVTGSHLFPAAVDPVSEWRYIALLWRSQLPSEGWEGLFSAIDLDRIWDNGKRDITLRPGETDGARSQRTREIDPYWSQNQEYRLTSDNPDSSYIWVRFDDLQLREQVWFLCDEADDTFAHALEPLATDLGKVTNTFHTYGSDPKRAVSAAHALVALLLASSKDSTQDELMIAYEDCLKIVIHGFAPSENKTRKLFRNIVLHQLAADQRRLPQDWLDSVIWKIQNAVNTGTDEGTELLRITGEALGFWGALNPAERHAFRSLARERTFASGAALMREGEPADHVIVILSGRTTISVQDNGRERIIAERGLGQLVGEQSALQVSVGSATVVASETVRALVMRADDFANFIRAHSATLGIIEGQIYRRLSVNSDQY